MILHSYPVAFALLDAGLEVYPIYKNDAGAWQMHPRTLTRTYVVHDMDVTPSYLGLSLGGVVVQDNGVVWPMAIFDEPINSASAHAGAFDVIGFVFNPVYLTFASYKKYITND